MQIAYQLFRRLRRAPGFTAIVLITLAIGIGANTAIFSVLNGVLIQPLNFPDSGRLIGVWHDAPGISGLPPNTRLGGSPSMYFTYRDHNQTFTSVGLWGLRGATVTGLAEPEALPTVQMTYATLDALAVAPELERRFTKEDDTPGSPATAILSYGYWQQAFGGDRAAIGKILRIDGQPHQIVGVMPASFLFPGGVQPAILRPSQLNRSKVYLGEFGYTVVARLKPGVTMQQAAEDVKRMLRIWLDEWPPFPGVPAQLFRTAGFAPNLSTLKSDVVGSIGDLLWILMGTIGLVLLIACANVANLLLVRTDGRRQELAIRAALGAGWGRIARGLLAESVGLSLLGGLLGLGLAWAGLRALLAYVGTNLPRAAEISIDPVVLLFTLAVSCLAGVLFGLIPVFKYAGPQIAGALRGGGRNSSQSRERHRARNMLVIVQVALAVVLMAGAGLMIRTFVALSSVNPGFNDPAHLQLFRAAISPSQVQDPEQVMRLQQQILERVSAIPGVQSAALSNSAPMEGFNNENPIYFRDRTYGTGEIPKLRHYKFVTPGSFRTFGTRILAGRDYTWTDLYERRPIAIISESMAREMWGSSSAALGHFLRPLPNASWKEIVGVVGDVADDGVNQPAPSIVYWPALNEGFFGPDTAVQRGSVYVVRSERAGTEAFLAELRKAVWSVRPDVPLALVRTLGEVYQTSLARTSYTLVLLGIAGAMALLLSIVGIYAVMSYSVAQRTREVGIRMALGAAHGQVQGMFVQQALLLLAIGALVGLASAAGATRLMSSLLFGVSALDPVTYLGVVVVIGAAALLAAYLPARRASRVDPLDALRAD